MTQRLILADDLTGANDTGVHLLTDTEGVTVVVGPDIDLSGIKTANIVINTNSRFLPPEEAYSTVREIFEGQLLTRGVTGFKKIDSTLRGNTGIEIDAMLDAGDFDIVCLTPAVPRNGRTVIDGRCYVNGEALEKTEIANDPFHPIKTSNIEDIISAQSRRRIGHLNLEQLHGPDSTSAYLQDLSRKGYDIIIADSESEDDLFAVINGFETSGLRVLYAGAAGLFHSMFRSRTKPKVPVSEEMVSEGILVAIGSLMPRSRRQLASLEACKGVEIGVLFEDALINNEDKAVMDTVDVLLHGLEKTDVAVLRTQPASLKVLERPEMISRAMGKVIRSIIDRRSLGLLTIVGGDTALGILRQLGISSLELKYEALPGVAAAVAVLADGRVLTVVTKSGSYGNDDVFCRLFEGVAFDDAI